MPKFDIVYIIIGFNKPHIKQKGLSDDVIIYHNHKDFDSYD